MLSNDHRVASESSSGIERGSGATVAPAMRMASDGVDKGRFKDCLEHGGVSHFLEKVNNAGTESATLGYDAVVLITSLGHQLVNV